VTTEPWWNRRNTTARPWLCTACPPGWPGRRLCASSWTFILYTTWGWLAQCCRTESSANPTPLCCVGGACADVSGSDVCHGKISEDRPFQLAQPPGRPSLHPPYDCVQWSPESCISSLKRPIRTISNCALCRLLTMCSAVNLHRQTLSISGCGRDDQITISCILGLLTALTDLALTDRQAQGSLGRDNQSAPVMPKGIEPLSGAQKGMRCKERRLDP